MKLRLAIRIAYANPVKACLLYTSSSSTKSTQQQQKVTGKVVDANNEPLIGVSVLEKGTTNGTITDFDGNYTLVVTGSNAVLQFSYVGYQTLERAVAGKTAINITLKEDAQVLDEVVVTALGIKRSEKALSYNVQQVNADAVTTNKDPNFINSLSGKVAGVNINASSSGVGGVSKVCLLYTSSQLHRQLFNCYRCRIALMQPV